MKIMITNKTDLKAVTVLKNDKVGTKVTVTTSNDRLFTFNVPSEFDLYFQYDTKSVD